MNILNLFKKKKARFFHVREMDYKAADEFCVQHLDAIKEMYLSIEHDVTHTTMPIPIVIDEKFLISPLAMTSVDGVSETAFGIPCIKVVWKNGEKSIFECYKEYEKEFISNTVRFKRDGLTVYKQKYFRPFIDDGRYNECNDAYDFMLRRGFLK